MPVAVSYPGVYIEEIPSGAHTITGVATSIAAFAGWATKGPTDHAEPVFSWPEFVRKFGGLVSGNYLGYSVYNFFNNGGSQAYIVRVVAGDATAATIAVDPKLTINANSAGAWGNNYAISTTIRPDDATRFQLVVSVTTDGKNYTPVEIFNNVSMALDNARYVTAVLQSESQYVTGVVNDHSAPPANSANIPLAGGADGTVLSPNNGNFETAILDPKGVTGIVMLDRVDLFNLLCVPGETNTAQIALYQTFCHERRAFLIVDAAHDDPPHTATLADLEKGAPAGLNNITGADSINSAFYFPWVSAPDPLQQNRPTDMPPCGFVAGIYARTDTTRGVWKTPAGTEASLGGISGLLTTLTDADNGILNQKGVNCIRTFPAYGTIVWGGRTLQGADQIGSEWKYVAVRRMALFIEESLYRGTKWVVFEPNDEPLWASVRLNVGAFMQGLFRQHAFQGSTPLDAYFVKCDNETTTQNDINLGVVNILVGFAPLKPAEFVVIQIQQITQSPQS